MWRASIRRQDSLAQAIGANSGASLEGGHGSASSLFAYGATASPPAPKPAAPRM
jgi:hypothetical protein